MMEPTSSAGQSNDMLQQTQRQVNEVVGIMRLNVEKVLERDQKLSDLDTRADALREEGDRFKTQAKKLHRKFWWKNLKMMLILGVITVVILIILIVYFTGSFGGSSGSSSDVDHPTTKAVEDTPSV